MQTKEEKYAALLPVVHSLMSDEQHPIARMANLAALLHNEFGFWWTGFYRVSEADDLVLGPFQGPLACTRIGLGKGVCGTAWANTNTFDKTDALWLEKIAACVYGPQRDIWFAAGCFWGAQKFFKMIPGVEFTEVGFANGTVSLVEKKLGCIFKLAEFHSDHPKG